jgi:serine/threonine protein phosphatase PrpC
LLSKPGMKITATAVSLTGRRPNNEDRYLVAEDLNLYAVADGMGGYAGGEVASRLTVEQLEAFVQRNRRDAAGTWPCKEDKRLTFAENLLRAAVRQAHDTIASQRQGELEQMGSTVVAVLVEGRRATLAHVGDSRIYRLRGGTLSQLTRDHSLWAELEAAGMEPGARAGFAHKNYITRALGIEANRPDLVTVEVEPGDRLLLCSDGLHDPLDETALEALMAGDCEAIAKAAYDAGSSDNITAVLLAVVA